MTIANCPRCQEEVRVPAGVSAHATVQCPLCREEYSLAEPLRKLPPELLVVDRMLAPPVDDVDIEGSWDTVGEAPDEVQPTNEFAFAPVVGDAKSEFDFDSPDASGPSPISSVRTSARRPKPKGSSIKSILSIAIGGMMAFPIAQLILWYLPGNLKRDFGAGPIVARYIPAIVPAKFRGQSANGDNSPDSDSVIPDFTAGTGEFVFGADTQPAAGNGQKRQKRQPKGVQSADGTSGDANFELPDMDGVFSQSAPSETGDATGTDEPGLELPGVELPGVELPGVDVPGVELPGVELPGLGVDPFSTLTEDPAPEDTDGSASPAASLSEPVEDPSPPATLTKRAVGSVKEAPVYEPAELADAISNATTASADWDAASESTVTGKQKTAFYKAMASLGEALAFSDRQDAAVAGQLAETNRLLAAVGENSAKVQAITAVESRWIEMTYERRGTDGICIHGTVASVEQRGELFETVVENNEWSVPVITREDPSDAIVVGKQVLVLGAIVPAPAESLSGYEGDAEVVILGGFQAAIVQE